MGTSEEHSWRAYWRKVGMCHMSMSHNGWIAWGKSLFARKSREEKKKEWVSCVRSKEAYGR